MAEPPRAAGAGNADVGSGAPSGAFRRRSPVLGTRGVVATSQPLASAAGARVLLRGGHAVDAAVAAAAALAVTEPCSTGIGGDCFAMVYEADTRRVTALNGSGRAARALSI
jgi:gamma-glutamyltranspeptidase / glutathione hydrolase